MYLSGSYTDQLEQLVDAPEGVDEVAALAERIRLIREQIPVRTTSAEEEAFTDAAEAQREAMILQRRRGPWRRI